MLKLYRSLLVISFTIQAVWLFVPEGVRYPPTLEDPFSWEMQYSVLGESLIYGGILLFSLMYFILMVGLFFFIRYARHAFLILVLASGLFSTLSGLSVQYGFEILANYYLTLIDGVILGMIYFSRLGQYFQRDHR